jgi:hypothetical protein
LDEHNRIIERWSNHDYAYRMQQIGGEQGYEEGRQLALRLNGPGQSEARVYQLIEEQTNAFNINHAPQDRERRVLSSFDPGVLVHGLAVSPAGFEELREHYRALWSSASIVVLSNQAMLSAWSHGAVRRTISAFPEEHAPDAQPMTLRGETIMRFNPSARIDEI